MSAQGGKGAARAALSGELSQLWASGFKLHQAGRLAEAAGAYRKVLAQAPDHFDSRHLLGVIALQQGRLEEAREDIAHAIRIDPAQGDAYSNLGTVLLRLNLLGEARAALETAVRLSPKDPAAAVNLGTVLLRQGEAAAAAARFRAALSCGAAPDVRNQLGAALLEAGDAAGAAREFQALLRQRPTHAPAHNNLGIALERTGDTRRALQEYERAFTLEPNDDGARSNHASLLARTGRLQEALRGFEEAVRRQPRSAAAHANLGALLRDTGRFAAAGAALAKALELDPKLAEARLNSASLALETGDAGRALAMLDGLLKDRPRNADAHTMRGRALLAAGRLAEAEAALGHALEIDARLAQAHHVLGLVRMAQGDAAGARASHEQAAALDPAHAQARWAAVMARLPALREREEEAQASRESFAQGLRDLDRWFDASRAPQGFTVVGSTQPFYLAYQAGNHKALLDAYGRLSDRLLRAWQDVPTAPAPASTAGRPIRIGFVSAQIRDHSVWTALLRGWVQHLDRSRFAVQLFNLSGASDEQTQAARALAQHVDTGPAGLHEWVERIQRAAPDVLVYPEIGMDGMAARLAGLRLAPLQLATWGHPITTGLPTVDAFISAAAFEPAGAQEHYTEQFVALPGLGVHYEPLLVKPQRIDRSALGLPANAPLLLCPGLPYKYAPLQDDLWVDIAQRLPEARLVFFRGGPQRAHEALRNRLKQRFAERGLDSEKHVCWLPLLGRPQFFGLMREACLFLDTVGFSGFNTVMQAVECELPVIAWEGEAMRGRFGSGVLKEVGLDECVATDAQSYADLAVALTRDAGQRTAIQAHLRKHRDRLFSTAAPVRALEDFIAQRLHSPA
jgi:protein O-GlcNAc transferase